MLQTYAVEETMEILEPSILYLFEWSGIIFVAHGRYLPRDSSMIVHNEAVPVVGDDVISF